MTTTTTTNATAPAVLDPVFQAYEEGSPALLLTGRSLYDLVADEGRLRPLVTALRRRCRDEHGMHLIVYSMAGGLDWEADLSDARDREAVERVLGAHRLRDIPPDQNEVVRVIRGLSLLSRSPAEGLRWVDGRPLRFAFLIEFAEHLTPGTLTNGTQTDAQLVAIELAHLTANSLALRASGNLVIFHAREGLVDQLVCAALRPVRLRQPDPVEKRAFLEQALGLYRQARFEPGLTNEGVVHLTSNTPNRSVEQLLRASHRTGRPVTARAVAAQKSRDVEELSEGTLTVLDSHRAAGVELSGANVRVPYRVLQRFAAGLLRADSAMPGNVLLAGGPGTVKTDLALLTAAAASVPAYQMHSPKSGIVGETERKARLQQLIVSEWIPNIAFVDEISEAFPLERSDFDGDSGATRAVMATLLTALSDETRRGRSLLIGTTNCPWRISAAMHSRFAVIPVLCPLEQDLPGIIASLARRLGAGVDPSDPALVDAARVFHGKGASPREILSGLSHVAMDRRGSLDRAAVLEAAHDLCSAADQASAIHADLWAIQCCSFRSFLPWHADPAGYPLPDYLKDIVDPASGEIRRDALHRRIEELAPHANV